MAKTIDYAKGNFLFPSPFIDPDQKDAKWYLRHAEALYSLDAKNLTALTASRKQDFTTYRLYGKGMQPTVKYMDQLCPLKPGDTERSGYMNISWDIVPILPKYRNVVLGQFQQLEYDITCSAIDEFSMGEKEDNKWMSWAKKQLDLSEIDKMAGAQDGIDDQMVKSMSSIEELKMYAEIGGFKMVEEVAMEKAINQTFAASDWSDIKNMIFEDLFDLGVAFSMDYYDKVEGRVKAKYLDPMCLIVRYSKDKTFKNIDTWGYMEEITIADLRVAAPELTERELYQIAASSLGINSNPISIKDGLVDQYRPDYGYHYDGFIVQVMYCEWDGINTKKFKKKTNAFGRETMYEAPYNYKPKNSTTEVVSTDLKTIHKCRWVIGTGHIYDWGILEDIPRESRKEASKSLRAYKVSDRSICANTIPICDAIQLNWLKFQNDIAMSVPNGVAVDVDAIGNITIDGQTWTPLQVLDLRRQTGDTLYSSINQIGDGQTGSRPLPVTPTAGGLGSALNERILTMRFYVEQLEEITGINKISAASTPKADTAVGVAKLSIGATNNVLQPLYYGYQNIKESIARNSMLRIQYLASIGKLDSYFPAISKADIEALRIGANVSSRKMGIKMEMRPTDEMKQSIRTHLANLAVKPPEQGGLSAADCLMVEYLLENSTIKIAMFYLAFKEKQNKMGAQQQMAQQQQMQSQAAQEQIQANAQVYQGNKQADAQAQIAIDNNQSQNKQKEIVLQGEIDAKLKKMEGDNAMIQHQSKLDSNERVTDKKIGADLEKHHTNNIKELSMAEPVAAEQAPPNPYQTIPNS